MQPGYGESSTDIDEGALDLLYDLGEEGDAFGLLETLLDADQRTDQATPEDALVPGPALEIRLTEEQRSLLGGEICDLLDEHDSAMKDRIGREQEVRDNYAMVSDSASDRGGTDTNSGEVRSEMTMSFVDQAFARIATGIMGIKPLMRCDAVEMAGFEGLNAKDMAEATERFLQEYSMHGPPDLRHKLPTALLECCKVGTSVFYVQWVEEVCRRRYYTPDSRDLQMKEYAEGKLKLSIVDNSDVKIWPPTVVNWQDATFIGHETRYTPQEWRAVAARYKISDEDREIIDGNPNDRSAIAEKDLKREGINAGGMLQRPELEPRALTELWCKMTLPGEEEPRAFQVIVHRPTRRLAYIGDNPFLYEGFPYFPIRYKWGRGAWADGVGQEIIWSHSADTAMWALELDNLMAGAYYVTLRTSGSLYNTQSDEPRPGMQIVVDDVDKDFRSLKLGGEAPELISSRQNNYMRARTGSGLSSVMSGTGDPVMKSGAGTGSVLALIEQGDKKMRQVDSNIRSDLSDLYMFMLQVVAQYAPDGLFYRYAGEDDAETLRLLKYTPPRGDIAQMFRLRAQAPSAGTSDEARKQNLLMVAGQAQVQLAGIDALVTEDLSTNNPAALPRWKRDLASYQLKIHEQIVKLHEVPRVSDAVPVIPEATSEDEIINDLNSQIQQLTSQLEQLQAQQQAAQAPPQAPGAEAGGAPGGAPPMMDQDGMMGQMMGGQMPMNGMGGQMPPPGMEGGNGMVA